MKKLTMIFLSSLILLTMLALIGCEKSGDDDKAVIKIDVLSPAAGDSVNVGDSITVTSRLSGFTFEYSKVNYYFGTSTIPTATFDKAKINALAITQEKDAQFDYAVSTADLTEGNTNLVVEAVGKDLTAYKVTLPIVLKMPTGDDTALSFVIATPANNTEFKIGDKISVEANIEGNLTLYDNFSAYLNQSSSPFYSSNTAEMSKKFDYNTEGMAAGDYIMKLVLTMKDGETNTRNLNFKLVEYIPTFDKSGEVGYALKSVIQTYDNGYLTVASDAANGTKVVKFDKEGNELWNKKIAATVGVAESVCEDTEYDKGYVMAGWRQNGSHKDTWVRKISMTDGSLIWNKQYGFINVEDGATVIKKSVDDGYIIGGYTYNIWGTELIDNVLFPGVTYATGYDIRLLKIYSNGNEVWGYNLGYTSHNMWRDISLHKKDDFLWVKKMGDQYLTDLVAKDDGNYLITGWNNNNLYEIDGTKKDMFFAECDIFGGFVNTMTWSRMYAYDLGNMAKKEDNLWGLNISLIGANALGDYTEDEIGYGLVESLGGFGGQVVMAGEAYEADDGPVKSKLSDAWVTEFLISGDEDGALWEYAFGDVAKNDIAYGIDQTKDGGYIITGFNTGTDKNTLLFKLDTYLALQWTKNLGMAGDDVGVKVLQATDGGFLIGCNAGSGSSSKARLIKVNKFGNSSKK